MSAAHLHPPTREIYLRHTSPEGKAYMRSHFVWDAAKFIDSQQKAASATNDDQKPGKPRLAKVEQITQEQYRKEQAQ